MPDINLSTGEGLIEYKIKAKQETYYLVTENDLGALKNKSVLSDLFIIIASLFWGAYFSIFINIRSLPSDSGLLPALAIYGKVFLGLSILFSILYLVMLVASYRQLNSIQKSKVDLDEKLKEKK